MAAQLKEPEMFDLKQSAKFWLVGSLVVLSINLIAFLFRNYFDFIISLWVVNLTPVAWLGLYFLPDLFERVTKFKNHKHF